MEQNAQVTKRHILLIYRRMIPSIRLCGHAQMQELAEQGKIEYRAIQEMHLKASDLAWADLVLLGRLDSWYELQLVKKLHITGKTLIYIMDDDLLNIPDEVTSASYYNQPCIQRYIREIIGLSDVILSPSPLLLKKYAVDGRKGILTEEPTLQPIPYKPRTEDRPVKIGFAGSVDRTGDFDGILQEALLQIQREYGERVTFEFFGGKPAFAEELGAHYIPYTESYDDYRDTLNSLEWDIGLAPMPKSDFHACKHYNKFTEYAAAGIAGIYSKVSPYDRLAAFPGCAVLCENRAEAWTDALRSLLEDHKLRENVRRKASECAAGPLSIQEISRKLLEELPESRTAKGNRFGILLPLKGMNVIKRFGTSVKGHGFGGFLKMMGSRMIGKIRN
ncbi:MAG: hypothetical protein IJQ71_07200 [Clostridia bacterium]|nr:hypothetical protein [Clostridia bacterium]